MYTMTIKADPIAIGANGPIGPESAITARKMNVPANSVSSLWARFMIGHLGTPLVAALGGLGCASVGEQRYRALRRSAGVRGRTSTLVAGGEAEGPC